MRLFKILLSACILCGFMACQSNEVTLVQYNVGAFHKYDSSSIEAIARAVKEMNADVVSLNEVDKCTARTGQVDQIAEFASAMGGWHHHFVEAIPYKGGSYGIGVASSADLKVVKQDEVHLQKFDGYENRALAIVEYEDFVYCSTHLDLTEASQIGQIEEINHYVDSVYKDSQKPIFIAGDFNSFPDSKPIALMKQSWTLLTPEANTYPSPDPNRCIDYIFVRENGKQVAVKNAEVLVSLQTADLATASDHLPVVLTVEIK